MMGEPEARSALVASATQKSHFGSQDVMLTDQQLEFVCDVSGGALFGVVIGAVCGVLVVAATLITDRRRASGVNRLAVPLYGLVPGAAAGAIVAGSFMAVTALVEATYCQRGGKSGYVIADRAALLVFGALFFFTLLAAAIAARLAVPHVGSRPKSAREVWRRAIAWSVLCAFIGAVAAVGMGFNGYQSNREPIRFAASGALLLATGGLLWRLTTGLLSARADFPGPTKTGDRRWAQVSPAKRTALALAWTVFLLIAGTSICGTIGVAVLLAIALCAGVVFVGRFNVRLAWSLFIVVCIVQPLLRISQSSTSFMIRGSITFLEPEIRGEALHLLSLALCGPLVWYVDQMRLQEFNPMVYVFVLPAAAFVQGAVVWLIGDLILRKRRATGRYWLAVLVLAVVLLFSWTFAANWHLI